MAKYAKLGLLRELFPNVPIMALTATANKPVIKNIIDRLGMKNHVFLQGSFNRPNLHYDIRPKTRGIINDIASFIRTRHPNQTGIIYCFSRQNCEDVAKALRDSHGILAEHYHAKMLKAEKEQAQAAWQSGEVKVIVSTVRPMALLYAEWC